MKKQIDRMACKVQDTNKSL